MKDWIKLTIFFVLSLAFIFLMIWGCIKVAKNIEDEKNYCNLYFHEKTGKNQWTQHDYPLLDEINKEAYEYYNVSYDYLLGNPPKKQIYVMGDGRASSWSFEDMKSQEPIIINCIFSGTIYDGDIIEHFEMAKEINYSELKSWREQYK